MNRNSNNNHIMDNEHDINGNNNMADEDDDDENIEYWKLKYEDLNSQYDEFQRQSYELENELELQLKQAEEKIRDLENKNTRLNFENDSFKAKLQELNMVTHKQILQLQEELAKSKAVKDEMQKYIRELEQKNDDLERANRCTMFTLGEFEAKMNDALERNAMLESELDEKDQLAETVQRLRDEARDLKQELAVRQRKDSNAIVPSIIQTQTSQPQQILNTFLSDTIMKSPSTTTAILSTSSPSTASVTTIQHADVSTNTTNQPHYKSSNSSNINALSYVGDVLRKVTSMESKLIASRHHLLKEPFSIKERRSIATINNFDKTTRKLFKRETPPMQNAP